MDKETGGEVVVRISRQRIGRGLIYLLLIALVVALGGTGKLMADARSDVRRLTITIEENKKTIAGQQKEIAFLQTQVKETSDKLTQTERQLAAAQAELLKTGKILTETRSKVTQAQGQLGKTKKELRTQAALTGLYVSLSRENLRNYCRSIQNEVLLSQNSLKNLRALETWMEVTELQLGSRLPSDVWVDHRRNKEVAERNLALAKEEKESMESTCSALG